MSAIRLCEDTGRQLLTALLTGQRRSFCLKGAAPHRLAQLRDGVPDFVQLSSERARQAVHQDCSFGHEAGVSPLLVVVEAGLKIARRLSFLRGGRRRPGTLSRKPGHAGRDGGNLQ